MGNNVWDNNFSRRIAANMMHVIDLNTDNQIDFDEYVTYIMITDWSTWSAKDDESAKMYGDK